MGTKWCGGWARRVAAATVVVAMSAGAALVRGDGLGWVGSNHAGKEAGEIGGAVSTSTAPFYYADAVAPKGLNESLSASGSICLPEQGATKAAVFVGWFNSGLKGWRFPTCVGFWVSGGEAPSDVVFTYALAGDWHRATGAAVTEFRIRRDGKRHRWTLSYDPKGNNGNGTVTLAVGGQKAFTANAPVGFAKGEMKLDRFGLLQAQAAGDPLAVYLDDLQYDGKAQDFKGDPGWKAGGGGEAVDPDFSKMQPHANTAIPTKPITQDSLADRIKPEPNGALSFYTRDKDDKLTKRFMITPEGSIVAGSTLRNGPDVALTSEPLMLRPAAYDNATNGARLSWVSDFLFSLNKSAGLGRMQSEGQPMLQLRVLALMGRGDSPDIQLGRTGPDNGRTNYGPLEATEAGSCLGKIIFKAYMRDDEKVEGEWTGDIAGIYARNEAVATRERAPASLHFTTAGASVKGNAWRENIERMVIRSNGYVGIGDEFTSPQERLHVKGNVRADGDVIATGAKKFAIPHPTQAGKTLVHAAVEGPEAAVYYRGEAQLQSGRAVVRLPEYFEALTLREGRTVMLTNVDGFDRLAVQRQDGQQVRQGAFVVVSENPASVQAFTWEVKAVRADVSPLVAER